VYSPRRDEDWSSLRLQGFVHDLIDGGAFELHYQPKISLRTNAVTGVEALLRVSRQGQSIAPPIVIHTAARMGLITELTDVVMDRAARDAAWLAGAGLPLRVSFNVTAEDLSSGTLAGRVEAAAKRYGVAPELLAIEVTEESVVADPHMAAVTAAELRTAGFAVSMDDFGVGYSSLTNLRNLVVDELKIDGSFASGIVCDARTAALVQSIVDMGHRLNTSVVIEGVEHEAERNAAQELGIETAQGWLFAKAMSRDELAAWIGRRTAADRLVAHTGSRQ
jgi:EAL domain-containing protein (putative c-di-GMP-specific phosphodiesterase class I)